MTHEPMLEGCRKAMLAELHRQGIRVIHDIACVDPHARHVEGWIDFDKLAQVAMEAARRPDPEAVMIAGNGPNTPAMMICAKLAEQGCAVPIALMEQAVAALNPSPVLVSENRG